MTETNIEFIICWDSGTWTTDIYRFTEEELILNDKGEIDFEKMCQQTMDLLVTQTINEKWADGPVHVGIYHVGEEENSND